MSNSNSPYKLTIGLTVLENLGIKLYSNVPAVLSEVIANSWDANAHNVYISLEDDKISITDDGYGMTQDDMNNKYLFVGYDKRHSADTPNSTRNVMGRKGIGKLSLFSIANTVTVMSRKGNEKNGFTMAADAIERIIKEKGGEGDYHPEPISKDIIDLTQSGTKIVITELKKDIKTLKPFLKQRIARRFSIIDNQNDVFNVFVNGVRISVSDRNYYHKFQFLWHFDPKYVGYCKDNLLENKALQNTIKLSVDRIEPISGWIASVNKPSELKDGNDNINKIVIMARGKLGQEDILEDFSEGGVYSKYLIGEIHADFLDTDDEPDMSTTSRQAYIEDDPRYVKLKEFLWDALKTIQQDWTEWRNKYGTAKAIELLPAVSDWLNQLQGDDHKIANELFGKINKLPLEDDDQKKVLFKQSVLAFESLRYKKKLSKIKKIDEQSIDTLIQLLCEADEIEAAAFFNIVQLRLDIIQTLKDLTDDNAIEKVIQEYLFEHLWLLDPSWERSTESPYMEEEVKREFGKIDAKLTEKEKKGRVDIRYKTPLNKHVIIELKRAKLSPPPTTTELQSQVLKYKSALSKLLASAGIQNKEIEIICVLGQSPKDWEDNPEFRETSVRALEVYNIRIVFYKELIRNAFEQYNEYFIHQEKIKRLVKLLENIENA
ncbi:MAG: ATP-binding protein [Candidatus Auribacterota bacterium]